MTCDFNVTVHVTNNTSGAFTGQSSTVSAWIVNVSLSAGQSADYHAHFVNQTSVEGWVRGQSVEGPVDDHWIASRPATCSAPTTTAPPPLDTTPKPVATTEPNQQVIYCEVPGANPPMQWPCDDLANAPKPTTTTSTAPPVASTDDPATTTAPAAPHASQPRTGPPRTVHTAITAQPVKSLPETGTSPALAMGGTGVLALGVALVWLTRRNDRGTTTA
jgi:LPXTG-motif cell wall-anchored protein